MIDLSSSSILKSLLGRLLFRGDGFPERIQNMPNHRVADNMIDLLNSFFCSILSGHTFFELDFREGNVHDKGRFYHLETCLTHSATGLQTRLNHILQW